MFSTFSSFESAILETTRPPVIQPWAVRLTEPPPLGFAHSKALLVPSCNICPAVAEPTAISVVGSKSLAVICPNA